MGLLSRHGSRIAVALIPLVFTLLHVTGALSIPVLQRLYDIYDARLRAAARLTLKSSSHDAKKYLYQLYSERVASMRLLPFDPERDGATLF